MRLHIPKLAEQSAERKAQQMLTRLKMAIKDSSAGRALCARYDVDPAVIMLAPIEFAPLPVSARTKDQRIYINEAFVEDGSFADQLHYVVHELCHWLQQRQDDPHSVIPTDGQPRHYLDMASELEAFMFQVAYIGEMYGRDAAVRYVDELLDFHELEGLERERKRSQLLQDG